MGLPVLYSYRRCPYAMRARMALKIADIDVEIREISLRDKPKQMLKVSPKGTVPVLVLDDGKVIDESLDIMLWAVSQQDAARWLSVDAEIAMQLIKENDTSFKSALDAYKYPERYPDKTQIAHRKNGEVFLISLENKLSQTPYLFGDRASFADVAIFPFVRQFAAVDSAWFNQSPYDHLRDWLNQWLASDLFNSVMQKHQTYME
jgi:glutathione S-transferase